MSWLNNLSGGSLIEGGSHSRRMTGVQSIELPDDVDIEKLEPVISQLGMFFKKEKDSGKVSLSYFPSTFKADPDKPLLDWLVDNDIKERLDQYQLYNIMDKQLPLISMALDIYADEALGVGFHSNPLRISINNHDIQTKVEDIFAKNKLLENARMFK